MKIVTGFFPSSAMVHIHHAAQSRLFEDAGLDVDTVPVHSAAHQLSLWDEGQLTVMHTSPDHLFGNRQRDPVAVRVEGLGELVLFERGDVEVPEVRYAVDGPASAFALVLRRILEHQERQWREEQFVPVGGTRERWSAMEEGRVDAALLNAPFTQLAERAGFRRIAGHEEVLPTLATAVVAAPSQADVLAGAHRYVSVLKQAETELIAGGPDLIAAVLERDGWASDLANLVSADTHAELVNRPKRDPWAGLVAAAELRGRFNPGWQPARPVERLWAGE